MATAAPGTYQTFHRELPADLDTPVSVFLRLKDRGPAFLLESVTGGEQLARYSFIGVDPGQVFVLRGRELEVHSNAGLERRSCPPDQSPLDMLRAALAPYRSTTPPHGLPRFFGGLVGYLSFDAVRFFETSVALEPHPDLPDAIFFHADTLVAFDHAFDRLLLIANAPDQEEAGRRLDQLEASLSAPLPRREHAGAAGPAEAFSSSHTPDAFARSVMQIKEHIAAGDIFQAVLSQRFSRTTTADPFDIYRNLRRLNPSPYMFFFDFGTLGTEVPFRLIGASPEMHVRLENGKAALRPIAGTRPRGASPEEDAALETELLADAKERAEHLMLIDLGRNDLGRVCEFGSVQVPVQFVVERYSHVMHIVSHAEGLLRPGLDAFDLLQATFPAGTVSGAPKIRALQIIRELEPAPRGPYAGAIGYFAYDGNADTCIALRSIVMLGDRIHVQAGAGIVADSDPEREFAETVNKARALAAAVELAEQRGSDGRNSSEHLESAQ